MEDFARHVCSKKLYPIIYSILQTSNENTQTYQVVVILI